MTLIPDYKTLLRLTDFLPLFVREPCFHQSTQIPDTRTNRSNHYEIDSIPPDDRGLGRSDGFDVREVPDDRRSSRAAHAPPRNGHGHGRTSPLHGCEAQPDR